MNIQDSWLNIYLYLNSILTIFNFIMIWKIIFILDKEQKRRKE